MTNKAKSRYLKLLYKIRSYGVKIKINNLNCRVDRVRGYYSGHGNRATIVLVKSRFDKDFDTFAATLIHEFGHYLSRCRFKSTTIWKEEIRAWELGRAELKDFLPPNFSKARKASLRTYQKFKNSRRRKLTLKDFNPIDLLILMKDEFK